MIGEKKESRQENIEAGEIHGQKFQVQEGEGNHDCFEDSIGTPMSQSFHGPSWHVEHGDTSHHT